ncbi:MAG: hypothetical protein M0P61_11725 [Ignavibacteriaceae bacterium]|nr:hypothetical protein [Ignavibacteriaceae bacterium]
MKHNYPKNRKPRDVSYSKSYKLVQQIGEEKLRDLFSKAGMYTVSKWLAELGYEATPYVVRHARKRYKLGDRINEKENL